MYKTHTMVVCWPRVFLTVEKLFVERWTLSFSKISIVRAKLKTNKNRYYNYWTVCSTYLSSWLSSNEHKYKKIIIINVQSCVKRGQISCKSKFRGTIVFFYIQKELSIQGAIRYYILMYRIDFRPQNRGWSAATAARDVSRV